MPTKHGATFQVYLINDKMEEYSQGFVTDRQMDSQKVQKQGLPQGAGIHKYHSSSLVLQYLPKLSLSFVLKNIPVFECPYLGV
jgi:hypothetical protein